MKYWRSRSLISKKQKMFSNRDEILMRNILTSDEILELFGNKEKIIKSKVFGKDRMDGNNFYISFLLRGGFVVEENDLRDINVQFPDYIPCEEKEVLLRDLDKMKMGIDASEYEVVELRFEYRGESVRTVSKSDSQVISIGRTKHFMAAPNYTVYYYNIIMTGYTGYDVLGKNVVYDTKETIFTIYKFPHYDLPVYIKFIGDMLERAVYLYDEYEEDY